MLVYLSGGMQSDWQDNVPKLPDVEHFDPRIHSPQFGSAIEFVDKDIQAVKTSDLVFCYIEKENPSGIGAAWECAVAKEEGIPIITVWEKDYIDPFFACNSLYLYSNFNKGVERLVKYLKSKVM